MLQIGNSYGSQKNERSISKKLKIVFEEMSPPQEKKGRTHRLVQTKSKSVGEIEIEIPGPKSKIQM